MDELPADQIFDIVGDDFTSYDLGLKIALALDALLYIFLGQWLAILIRLWQGRKWRHRFAGRGLVIGDVPWVAQSLES